MADPKRPSKTPSTATEPAVSSKAEGIDPKAVYVGGESLADRLLPHAKKIGAALLAVAVVLGAYFTYGWWKHRKAEKATTLLMNALNEGQLEVVEPDPKAEPPDPDLPPPPRTFATEAERTEATLAALSKVSGSHRKAVALLEAKLLLSAGRAPDADKIYQSASSMKGVEGVLAREGLAYGAEQAALALDPGDARDAALRNALELYRAAQPDEEGPRRDVALYNEGRLLALLGDKDGAKAAFAKAVAKAGEDLQATIEMRLSQLDAKALPEVPAPGAIKPKPETPATPETPAATPDGGAAAPAPTPDAGG